MAVYSEVTWKWLVGVLVGILLLVSGAAANVLVTQVRSSMCEIVDLQKAVVMLKESGTSTKDSLADIKRDLSEMKHMIERHALAQVGVP
jgi:uncharacterized protein YpmS